MPDLAELLDREYAPYFGCQPEDLRAGGVTVLAGGGHPLTVAATATGGIVASALVDPARLRAAVGGCAGRDLLDPARLRRLIGLLPSRGRPWSVDEQNVLLYCTGETFRACPGSVEPVRPDDAFWQGARRTEQDFAEQGRTWRVEAACAVYVGSERASTGTLVDQGRDPFRAVGVSTAPALRGRGYAKACVSALTAWALQHGVVPLYNTQTCNAASMAVARAAGYVEYVRYLSVT